MVSVVICEQSDGLPLARRLLPVVELLEKEPLRVRGGYFSLLLRDLTTEITSFAIETISFASLTANLASSMISAISIRCTFPEAAPTPITQVYNIKHHTPNVKSGIACKAVPLRGLAGGYRHARRYNDTCRRRP